MKNWITQLLLIPVLFLILLSGTFAQINNPWADTDENSLPSKTHQRYLVPSKYRSVSLDLSALQSGLQNTPMRFSPESMNVQQELVLPMPDGSFQRFSVVEAPVMHPQLQARYPDMRSFAGKGLDDPTAYLRFSLTHKGFHAMVMSAKNGTAFIDPYFKGNTEYYVCYYKKDYAPGEANVFSCGVETPEEDFIKKISPSPSPAAPNTPVQNFIAGDCQLRKYRLALACTGEYATFHGGTVASVMAEYVIAMTRVNGVYEKDMTLTMELVPNTDDLIFLNGATDPYSNGSGGAMLGQNQTTCDDIIGPANYDIGHVFSTGGGGVASLAVPCTNNKARGVTGLTSPVGDPFYIDYVAHEMGHQYGANHTQNNSCNRNNSTAMEPGSASTIMGYAGICAPNVQNNSDDHFHAISIQEMTNNIENGNSSSCPVIIGTGNNAPSASVAQSFYNLPVSTPFALTCIGSDPDDDVLTYNWEQMNNQVATMPPAPTNTGGPAFRSNSSTESPTRYFPNLQAIIDNTMPTWEVLPSVSRTMDFRCTVRDNFPGGGCRDEVDVDLSFHQSAGPFLVLYPNANLTWIVGAQETILWDVANTDQAPVSCSNVDILMSLDGGYTYPINLASGVPNTGSYTINVLNTPTETARVKVVCSDNIFFDISNENFVIELPGTPTFLMDISPASQIACNTEDVVFNLDFTQVLDFDEEINLSVTGLPGGATAEFNENPLLAPANVQLTVGNLSGISSGTYVITVIADGGAISLDSEIEITITDGVPGAIVQQVPVDGATGVELAASLEWAISGTVSSYFVEIATSPGFGNTVIVSEEVSGNTFQAQDLEEQTIYYWRVKGMNICGEGEFAEVFAFQTKKSGCFTFESTDVPINISSNSTVTITSTLNVPDDFVIDDVDMDLFIEHSWVGDLIVDLTSPEGTTVEIFDQPGVPGSTYGCSGNNILASFNDDATNSADVFENTCEPSEPTISGAYQPITPLSTLNGESSSGTWTLTLRDMFDEDGGALNFWSLDLCTEVLSSEPPDLITNLELTVLQGTNEIITNSFLDVQSPSSSPDEIIFTILSIPANGALWLEVGGIPTELAIGDQFTQQDINNHYLSYTHDGSVNFSDDFDFDVVDSENGWLHNSTFLINILENDFAASATLDIDIDCFNANNGQISVTANGGTAPFEYSIDGIDFQDENIFENLAPGAYTFTVKDANNFTTTTNEIIVSNPDQLMINAVVDVDEITANASGGTGELQYSIDGIDYQTSNVFSDLENGFYTVYVKDENGCIAEDEAVVAVNTIIASATLIQGLDCHDDTNGEIEVNVGGGTPDFTYSLNGGPFQSGNVFSGLGAGNYVVTVMDDDGFTAETNEIIISNPPELTLTLDVTDDDITANGSGGSGTLEYSINGIDYQSSPDFNDLANGDYTIFVRDENGCVAEAEAAILVNTLVVSATLIQGLDCHDDADGEIEVSVNGGTPDYTYSLNGGAFQSENVFSDLGAGSYIITVMDNDGFTAETNEIIINNPPELTATADVNGYDITVNASGGTGNLQYSLNGGAFQSSNLFPGNSTGDYTIVVVDENGCEIELSASVMVEMLALSITSEDISCYNFNDGSITATATGGVPPYQYSINGVDFQDENTFSGLAAGSYTITVMDSGGFTFTSPAIEIVNPEELILDLMVDLDDVTLGASGGTPPYLYSIDGVDFQPNNFFEDLENGEYTFYIQDANGCEVSGSTIIDISGTAELATDLYINIYPNPGNGIFMVEVKQNAALDLRFKVFDAAGKLVFSEIVQAAATEVETLLDLQHLPNGTYHLMLGNDEQLHVKKLVVLR